MSEVQTRHKILVCRERPATLWGETGARSIAEIRTDWDAWLHARDAWLAVQESVKTRRAYGYAWWSFFQVYLNDETDTASWSLWALGSDLASKRGPWQVGGSEVVDWQQSLRDAGLATGTVNQRLSAISSYYSFCQGPFTVMANEGEEPLAAKNPTRKAKRCQETPYYKARPLSAEQTAAVLRVIPRCTVQGLRDYALVAGYLYLGRRSSELARLTWGDVFEAKGSRWYRWRGKRGEGVNEMDPHVWRAILEYLRAAGRLDEDGKMAADAYIFTALCDNATRLPSFQERLERLGLTPGQYEPAAWPLDGSTIYRLVRKYCRKAGAPLVRVHDLRHTAADLRGDEDIRDTAHFLGHSNLNTTEIYKRHRTLRPDRAQGKARLAVEQAIKNQEKKEK